MQRNIKLTIEYDGTLFCGWQVQEARNEHSKSSTGKSQRTVQGEIEKALKKIYKKNIVLNGSGRTDSGVHARGQVANFKTSSAMPLTEMQSALNANLPDDISIVNVEEASPKFHAQYSVRSKMYRYTILNRNSRCSLERTTCLYYPYKLNLTAMRRESQSLIGTMDFRSFTASDPSKAKRGKKENTVRTIKKLKITKKGPQIMIDIEADGFLYKMVRNIVGTLLEVGSGKLGGGSIKKILAQKSRNAAGYTAKAKGLALIEVCY